MTVERAQTYARVARTVEPVSPVEDANRVWYGGMLDPIIVEVSAPPEKCPIA